MHSWFSKSTINFQLQSNLEIAQTYLTPFWPSPLNFYPLALVTSGELMHFYASLCSSFLTPRRVFSFGQIQMWPFNLWPHEWTGALPGAIFGGPFSLLPGPPE